ncbi:unnamed protein product [Rotaria sordida]|uniref:protein kinase C n=1 Tax=Rotaria sordida TaxID=392033 RepID=A0A814VVW5_9BILA|nr:unnamed protein product [Rotaria sordida]
MNNFEYQERVGMFNDVLMCNSADLNLPFDIYKLFDENENLADQYADLNEVSSNIDKIGLEMAQHNKESFHTLKFTKEEFYRHIDSFKFHLQQDIQKARDPKIAKKIENERKLFLHIPGHDLIQEEQIGQGGYADVYHGKWLSRHHDVAIKVIRVNNITDIVKQGFLKEITTMYQIRYEHVLNVLGACIESNYYALVMEYMSLGSLYDLLKNKEQTLSWPIRWSLALQMTKGINCLHMMSILHRDIKSSNFLIEMAPNGYLVKVADFSLAQIRSESSRQSISNTSRKIPSGTLRWTAPELFANGKSSMASDVYSLGMAFWEVATRCIPYEDANDIIIVTTVSVGNRPPIPADVPSTFAAIIFDSWNQEPSRRPTCQELIRRLETNASIFQSGNAITPYPTTTTNVLCQMPLPQYTNNTPYESKTLQTSYGWKKEIVTTVQHQSNILTENIDRSTFNTETSKIEDEQARRVTLAIHDLMLYNNCPIYDDDDYANIFISINFLNYPPEERETPEALPKKRPFTVYCFNFQKDYFVHNPEQQAQLAKLISFDSSGEIRFDVVAEPCNNKQTLDCIDVGYATVNVKQLLQIDSDYIKQSIDVISANEKKQIIGQISITVVIVQALKLAQQQNHQVQKPDDTSGTTSNLQASLQPQSSHFLTNDNDNNEIQGTDIDLLALYTKLTLNHNNEPRATSRSSTPVSRISLSDNSNRASRLRLAAIRARINANSNPHRPRRPRADAKIKNRRPSTPARSK